MEDSRASWQWRMVSTDAPKATAKWLTARTLSVLALYYQPGTDPELDRLSMAIWLHDLGEFPQDALDQAFTYWTRNERRRPTPADIRVLSYNCMMKEDPLRRRVEMAREWLEKKGDIPEWLASQEIGEVLANEGYDYDKLRNAGFRLPFRGTLIDMDEVRRKGLLPRLKRMTTSPID